MQMSLIRSIASHYIAEEQRDHGALRCIWQLCIAYFECTNAEYMYAYCNAFTLHMDIFNGKHIPVFPCNIDDNWKIYVNIVQVYLMDFFF